MALLAIPHDELQLMAQMLQQQEDGALLLLLLQHRRRLRRPRRFGVQPWIDQRLELGQYHNLMVELEREHHGDFTNYLRMDPAMYHELLQRMTQRLRLRPWGASCHVGDWGRPGKRRAAG